MLCHCKFPCMCPAPCQQNLSVAAYPQHLSDLWDASGHDSVSTSSAEAQGPYSPGACLLQHAYDLYKKTLFTCALLVNAMQCALSQYMFAGAGHVDASGRSLWCSHDRVRLGRSMLPRGECQQDMADGSDSGRPYRCIPLPLQCLYPGQAHHGHQ